MRVIETMRRQSCIYWQCTGLNKNGQESFAAPLVILCRWDDETKKVIKPDGVEMTTRSVAYVDRVVPIGSFLMLGDDDDLAAFSDSSDPLEIADALRVEQFAMNAAPKGGMFKKTPNYQDEDENVLMTAYM